MGWLHVFHNTKRFWKDWEYRLTDWLLQICNKNNYNMVTQNHWIIHLTTVLDEGSQITWLVTPAEVNSLHQTLMNHVARAKEHIKHQEEEKKEEETNKPGCKTDSSSRLSCATICTVGKKKLIFIFLRILNQTKYILFCTQSTLLWSGRLIGTVDQPFKVSV